MAMISSPRVRGRRLYHLLLNFRNGLSNKEASDFLSQFRICMQIGKTQDDIAQVLDQLRAAVYSGEWMPPAESARLAAEVSKEDAAEVSRG